ncbi:MAG: flagellar hook-associated protein 3 FlgL [Thermoleophilaceae bacterium]|jgi:flagellar hook-associated protein 3 FlgL|nr:flagellar hook-associated protein 3 FlgL [Thermoleophilaceae bacterium]
MSTRITGNMISRSVLNDLNEVSQRLAKTQQRMSSGKQITRPSDDPYGTSRALSLRSDLAGTQQYQRNVGEAVAWQSVTDSALSKITEAVQRARDLAVQGASDSAGQAARNAAAAEIDQLIASVKQEANASYGGRYVFAGTNTNIPPYDVSAASDAYSGDTGVVAREIGPGVSVPVNVLGVDLLGQGQLAGDGKLLDVLRDLSDHLKSGTVVDMNTLRTADLKAIDTNLDAISQTRATVGATTNRLESADGRLQQVEESLTKLLSDVEDADMAKTYVDFSMQQSVYQSALRAGSNIVQQSLLDFLR